MNYPHEAGHRGVDTSVSAAAAINHSAETIRFMIVDALRGVLSAGATAHELAAHLRVDYGSVQPRTSELQGKFIKDSGLRRPTPSGKSSKVWVAI